MNQEKSPMEVAAAICQQTAEQLDEVDYLKLRLLNRNVDFFTAQIELAQMQSMEATRALMAYSKDLVDRYDLKDTRQVDVHTGKIIRDLSKLGIPGSSQ